MNPDYGLPLRFVVEGTTIDMDVDPHAPLAIAGRDAVARWVPGVDGAPPAGPVPVPARDRKDDWFLHTLTGTRLDARRSAASYGLDPNTTVLVVRALNVGR